MPAPRVPDVVPAADGYVVAYVDGRLRIAALPAHGSDGTLAAQLHGQRVESVGSAAPAMAVAALIHAARGSGSPARLAVRGWPARGLSAMVEALPLDGVGAAGALVRLRLLDANDEPVRRGQVKSSAMLADATASFRGDIGAPADPRLVSADATWTSWLGATCAADLTGATTERALPASPELHRLLRAQLSVNSSASLQRIRTGPWPDGKERLIDVVIDVVRMRAGGRDLVVHLTDWTGLSDEDREPDPARAQTGAMALCRVEAGGVARLVYADEELARLLDRPAHRLVGRRLGSLVQGEGRVPLREVLARTARGQLPRASMPVALAGRQGRAVPALLSLVWPVAGPGWVVVSASEEDPPAASNPLSHRYYAPTLLWDPLTGLANRLLLRDRLQHALRRGRRGATLVAAVFLDLDDFKRVNDEHGHAVGDELLVAVSERLRDTLRETDTAARLGGDEFVLLCEDLQDEQEAARIGLRTVQRLRRPYALSVGIIRVTVSAGIAVARARHESADHLLHEADLAMYEAKRRGKNQWAVFDDDHHRELLRRLSLVEDLRHALARRQLRLVFQPVVRASDGRLIAAEALLRWRHPVLGELRPAQFLPVAERTQIIDAIGGWVVEQACQHLAGWRREYVAADTLQVTVNAGASQLGRGIFPGIVARALERNGLAPGSLRLEVPAIEWLRMDEPARHELRELSARGVVIGLDDFGRAPLSLDALEVCSPRYVSLERPLVASGATADTPHAGLVVGIAHAAGLEVVAKGVRGSRELERMRELGCELLQGSAIGRPRSGDGLGKLLSVNDHRATSRSSTAFARSRRGVSGPSNRLGTTDSCSGG